MEDPYKKHTIQMLPELLVEVIELQKDNRCTRILGMAIRKWLRSAWLTIREGKW